MGTSRDQPYHQPASQPERRLDLGRRLLWTIVLVLAAMGGAGLATAADGPPTDADRPELTWRAEQAARPWLDSMAARLVALDEAASALSAAGRGALISLAVGDADRLEAALGEGDELVTALEQARAELRAERERQRAVVPDWRLGQRSVELLHAIDAAVAASAELPMAWAELAAAGRSYDQAAVTQRLIEIEEGRAPINEALALLPGNEPGP